MKKTPLTRICQTTLLASLSLGLPSLAHANSPQWAEGYCDSQTSEGATRDFYNRGTQFAWQNYLGDWFDRNGTPQGNDPFALITIPDTDQQQRLSADITELVGLWHSGQASNNGLFLQGIGAGKTQIISKEHVDTAAHPELLLQTSAGSFHLPAQADTTLRGYTYTCAGQESTLTTVGNLLIYFDLSAVPADASIHSAQLAISTDQNQYGEEQLAVQAVRIPRKHYGGGSLASQYPNDFKIAFDHPGIFAESFEHDDWQANWSFVGFPENLATVTHNDAEQFAPLMGKALEVTMPAGGRDALNVIYRFADKIGEDVEAVYFRYYLRFGDSWQTLDQGKLPGLAGTYAGEDHQGGWGGRRSTGENGWSTRGAYRNVLKPGNTYSGQVPVGNYIYHADQPGGYGDVFIWDGDTPGVLEKNRWYSIEQYVKLNTPGQNDGILRTWIDGQPAYEKTDLRFRNQGFDHIKIDRVWLNIFHGGTISIDRTVKAYIDNVVVAYDYIGPIQFDLNTPLAGSEPNRLPVIGQATPSQTTLNANINETIDFSVSAWDPDGGELQLEWYLDGVKVAENQSHYQVTPSVFDLGTHTLEFRATDSENGQSSQQWQYTLDSQNWQTLSVAEDTVIVPYTFQAQGQQPTFRITHNHSGYLRFGNLPNIDSQAIQSAYLVLYTDAQYGDIDLSIFAAGQNWFEGAHVTDGSTRQYFDHQQQLPWQNYLGDWTDAAGVANGSQAYSVSLIEDTDTPRFVAVEVTELVRQQWLTGEINAVLKATTSGKQDFHSKENATLDTQPQLMIQQY